MVQHEVYRHPLYRSYQASVCSKAAAFQLLTTIIVIVVPLLIAYRSRGFWQKTNTYKEQPDVSYTNRFILYAHSKNSDKGVVFSTFPLLNEMLGNQLRPGVVKTYSNDVNKDGKTDTFTFEITLPLNADETITSIEMILLFDYRLSLLSRYQMSGLVYTSQTAGIGDAIGALSISGDLKLVQRAPLSYHGSTLDEDPVVNASSMNPKEYQFLNILHRDSARNESTRLVNVYTAHKRVTGSPRIHVSLHVHVPVDTIEYWTGFWELIKWAWIQYLSILVVLIFVMNRLREFVFTNFLVNTVPKTDPIVMQAVSSATGCELQKLSQ